MKKLVLISSYCDSDDKKTILKENLIKYKELGLDTLLISPLKLENEIIDLCDYYFYTKENPILCWPERAYTHWLIIHLNEEKCITIHRGHCDYGWAALYQTKKLFQLGLDLDYDMFIHTIYDLDIDDYVCEKLKTEERNMIFTRRDPNNTDFLWDATLHLLIVNREGAEKIENSITREVYVNSDGFAEGHVLKWKNEYGFISSEEPIKDKIFYWEGYNHFDYSLNPNYKVFFAKNDDLNRNFSILVYDIQTLETVDVFLNNEKLSYEKSNYNLIRTEVDFFDVKDLKIKCGEVVDDYLEIYNNISRNVINDGC